MLLGFYFSHTILRRMVNGEMWMKEFTKTETNTTLSQQAEPYCASLYVAVSYSDDGCMDWVRLDPLTQSYVTPT